LPADSYDLSLGGSYEFGLNASHKDLTGFYQRITAPFSFTYYGKTNGVFGYGLRNQFGYGLTFYDSYIDRRHTYYAPDMKEYWYQINVRYQGAPVEHEIYENISYIIKAGKPKDTGDAVRFVAGAGLSMKVSFFDVPDSAVTYETDLVTPYLDYTQLNAGIHPYFSLGPTFDLGLEAVFPDKNFSFAVKVPFEFLFHFSDLPGTRLTAGDLSVIPEPGWFASQVRYINFTMGLEVSCSYYFLKEY
jgi:hypothetical protein